MSPLVVASLFPWIAVAHGWSVSPRDEVRIGSAQRVFAAYPELTRSLLTQPRGTDPLRHRRDGDDPNRFMDEYDASEIYARTGGERANRFFREEYLKAERLPVERAMVGLAAASGPRFTGELLRHLGTPSRRLVAIEALGVGRDPRAIPQLLHIALEPVPESCWSSEPRYSYHAMDALVQMGSVALPTLHRTLQSGDPKLRGVAILTLSRIRNPLSIAPLARALRTETDLANRESAVYALARLGDGRVLTEFLNSLKKDHPSDFAALALAKFHRDPRALALLRQWAKEGKAGCAIYARLGYTDLREHWEANLTQGYDSDQYPDGLAALGDPRSIPALVNYLEQHREWAPIKALAQMGKSAIPALIALLDSEDSKLQADAIAVLGYIGDLSAMPALNKLAERQPTAVRFAKLNIVLASAARKVRVP